jgi:hemolysin III
MTATDVSSGTALVPPRVERANALSHGVGLILAVAATPILIINAVGRGGAGDIVGASLFGASMILLYLASTWFHSASPGVVRDRLQRFDHAAIYLLIAGTYTPFTLGVLGGGWGWTLFGITWGAAAIGVTTKVFGVIPHPRLSAALYLLMGWLVVIALRPLLEVVPPQGIAWLVAGGLAYSIGVPFYLSRRLEYGHVVWHLFVLTGSVCHFFAVLGYAAGPGAGFDGG